VVGGGMLSDTVEPMLSIDASTVVCSCLISNYNAEFYLQQRIGMEVCSFTLNLARLSYYYCWRRGGNHAGIFVDQ
jgi:hypothetical protein